MPKRVPGTLSAEALLAVLAGLAAASCDKTAPDAKPEPPATASAAAVTAPAGSAVGAKEVPSAAGSAQEKAGSCTPGGCAPGKCGGSKK